jgi:hypothetical protein
VERLPKYHYKPIFAKVQEAYLANAKKDYEPGIDIESDVVMIVNADSEEHSQQICYGFVDVGMWKLHKIDIEE